MSTKNPPIQLTVAKWGNSLAVRLPVELAKRLGVGEGDTLVAQLSSDGRLILAREGHAIGKVEARRLRQFLEHQSETAPAVERMRREARF